MRVGAHESIAGGVSRALARAEEHGARSPRVFTKNARGKGAIGLTPFRCLMKDARFVNTIGILETPYPERYAEAIRRLESLGRRK